MDQNTSDALKQAALQASAASYSPYSGYPVGAAVLTESGKIYQGTNVENASYGATVCAERVAIFKAVSTCLWVFIGSLTKSKVKEGQDSFAFLARTVLSSPPEKHMTGSLRAASLSFSSGMIPFMHRYCREY